MELGFGRARVGCLAQREPMCPSLSLLIVTRTCKQLVKMLVSQMRAPNRAVCAVAQAKRQQTVARPVRTHAAATSDADVAKALSVPGSSALGALYQVRPGQVPSSTLGHVLPTTLAAIQEAKDVLLVSRRRQRRELLRRSIGDACTLMDRGSLAMHGARCPRSPCLATHPCPCACRPPWVHHQIRDTNGWCPYCERIVMYLEEKGIPYDSMLVDLRAKPEWWVSGCPCCGKEEGLGCGASPPDLGAAGTRHTPSQEGQARHPDVDAAAAAVPPRSLVAVPDCVRQPAALPPPCPAGTHPWCPPARCRRCACAAASRCCGRAKTSCWPWRRASPRHPPSCRRPAPKMSRCVSVWGAALPRCACLWGP